MDVGLKKILKPVTLALRHLLEGEYDAAGQWKPGDLERRLAALGVRRDRASVPTDELEHLPAEDRHARKVVDAYIKLREEAGVARSDAVAEFIRETAYTWANRLSPALYGSPRADRPGHPSARSLRRPIA